jgi:hypothetical protein
MPAAPHSLRNTSTSFLQHSRPKLQHRLESAFSSGKIDKKKHRFHLQRLVEVLGSLSAQPINTLCESIQEEETSSESKSKRDMIIHTRSRARRSADNVHPANMQQSRELDDRGVVGPVSSSTSFRGIAIGLRLVKLGPAPRVASCLRGELGPTNWAGEKTGP